MPEMCRQLRRVATEAGDKLPDNECLVTMIRRWENGSGVSERYRLHYCRALGLLPEDFGRAAASRPPGKLSRSPEPTPNLPLPEIAVAGQGRLASTDEVDGGNGRQTLGCEVLATAHEGSEHVERAERREIGDATLEQLRAEVTRLSREYMTGEPVPLFFAMRRVRGRLHAALDRQIWPRDRTEVYFLLGLLSALMADAANDAGAPAAAEELARTGCAYATVIDHRPLKACLRLELALIARWTCQPVRCRDEALTGLESLSRGPHGAQLHLLHGIACARLGDADGARQAMAAASDSREHEYSDELLEIGGQFGFSRATQHYYAGSLAIELPDAESDAIAWLEQAMKLYAAGPEPGEHHSLHCRMRALADLASARLRAGQFDAAESAAALIFELPPNWRAAPLPRHLDRVRAELAKPAYQGLSAARELEERIEWFCRDTISRQLGLLPAQDPR